MRYSLFRGVGKPVSRLTHFQETARSNRAPATNFPDMGFNAAINALAAHFTEGSVPHSGIKISLYQPILHHVIEDPDIRAVYEMEKHGISMRRQTPWVKRGFRRKDIVDGLCRMRGIE